jgi:hypothetical protein
MDDRKMQIIQDLMDQLQEELKPSGDELGERLGRPKIEVAQMDGDIGDPGPEMEAGEKGEMGEMGEDPDKEMDDSPEESLRRRLMKLRE